MALALADRVKETSTSTGTSAIALGGAQTRYQAFDDVVADGDAVTYAIDNPDNGEWETGLGVYSQSSGILRASEGVFASSNAGALVNFTSGTKSVALVPAALLPFLTCPAALVGSVMSLGTGNFTKFFGNGSDGDLIASSGTTTLSANAQYRRVVLTGTAKIDTNGYVLRAWILDLRNAGASAIHNDGGDGQSASGTTAGKAGAGPGQNTIGGAESNAGKAGAAAKADGTDGGNIGGVGGDGGAGGEGGDDPDGGDPQAGGSGGACTGSYSVTSGSSYIDSSGSIVSAFAAIEGGAPGGSGGGSNDSGGAAGGGSGAGGGVVLVAAAILLVGNSTAAGAISAHGGDGGNGGAGATGKSGGGGGGGGGGGWVNVVYLHKIGSKSGAIACNGGDGGDGGNGAPGTDGGDGGGGGDGGRATTIDLIAGTVTDETGTAGTAGGTATTTTGASGGAGGTLSVDL